MKTLPDHVCDVAEGYIGQEEIKGNQGFKNPVFEKKMKSRIGWRTGDAWCAAYAELVWREGCDRARVMGLTDVPMDDRLNELFSLSAVATYENYEKAKDFLVGHYPERGALMVWRHWSRDENGVLTPSWMGHIGIVTELTMSQDEAIKKVNTSSQFTVKTVEGNGNPRGGREGYAVVQKDRLVMYERHVGLNLLGFVYLHS